MHSKLILVEGLPGSGKSTFSYRIAKHLKEQGIQAKCYIEGYAHPADFAWSAYLDAETYQSLQQEFPQYIDLMHEHAMASGDHVVIPYLDLELEKEGRALHDKLAQHEIFSAKYSTEAFLDLHLDRWREFCQKAMDESTVHVFECAYLQNHINEMMLYHDTPVEAMNDYFRRLINTVKELNPRLIYLGQQDVDTNIRWIAKRRVSDDPDSPDWIDRVADYFADSPYGKRHGIKDIEGVIDYFAKRQENELYVLKHLPIQSSVMYKNDDNWDQFLGKVIAELA